MAPTISKYYPIITCVFSCTPPSSGKPCFLGPPASPQLDSLTSLAHLGENHVDSYLKQIIRHLKNLFQKGPDVIGSIEWSILSRFLTQGTSTTMLEGLMLLNLSFLHGQAFITKVAQFCNTSEIGEAEELAKIKKLLKLKEHLVELTGFLDKILMTYSHVGNTSNLPIVKDFKCLVKKLGKVIAGINPQSFSQLIPNSIVTEEDILCSVLGLQHDVADRLRNLDPGVRSHQSDMYFLQSFLADQDESPESGECLTNTEAVSSKLQEMGFTKGRSVVIAKWIAQQRCAEHWSLLAWAQHYIQNLFTYDIFLNERVSRYPYQENKQNEWFSHSFERDGDGDGDGDEVVKAKVQISNTTSEGLSELIKEKKQQCEQQPGDCLYYHGTDHNSAKSILNDGIKLEEGKSHCDFSNGKGFYVADDAMYAFGWAKKSNLPALLVFNIRDESLITEFKGLDLSPTDRKPDWKLVTNYYRSSCPNAIAKELRKRKLMNVCCKSDYIKGPISRDGNKENPEKKDIQQICIRKEHMALSIGSLTNIFGVIFVN